MSCTLEDSPSLIEFGVKNKGPGRFDTSVCTTGERMTPYVVSESCFRFIVPYPFSCYPTKGVSHVSEWEQHGDESLLGLVPKEDEYMS